ncbi:MAG: asparagine synthase (glutamine-hydrolyzing) [Haliscomenobacter sp.]|uniref:asparagine synthase (glutamine-hydrolyzing) n=1 Tax=Haliscomenobacter sp. TaxID=2717303 RepID=UPI0029B64732|nr:asparagine synthase (glutamine-hydrolyzing) [Haliscomenobacter sp.]MDX2067878.1 asparagine synthase (glutamine-hydrolyzing) [Haliscomenobacter sp.]
MCGINGLYAPSKTPIVGQPSQLVQQMNQTLAHRGPDDAGIWHEGPITLGHRRLSIIDLSSGGHQPMFSADERYVLTFNGEIYNYRELKAQLPDYPFQSNSDSEVILAAYQHWGTACVSQLVGMFAFAIWDRQAQTLFIARDRLGIKPLYYCQKDGVLVFSSELRGILASGLCARQLNTNALVDYLRYQTVHAPDTIVAGIQMLEPGTYLWQSADDFYIEKYWQLVPGASEKEETGNWPEQVQEALKKAVERRLIADVPFGAFLSGGIDSSAIVALMSQLSNQPVRSFNISFQEDQYDESIYAREMAQRCHTKHEEIKLSADDFLNLLPAALSALDHPSGDGPNTYVVSKVTREAGVSMALSGLGGDELFGGYSVFPQLDSLQQRDWLNWAPLSVRRWGASLYQSLRPGIAAQKTAKVLSLPQITALAAYPIYRQVLMDEQIMELTNFQELPNNRVQEQIQTLLLNPGFVNLPLYSQISILEIQTYLQNVLLRDTDQMSMAHALEVRVPFMDHNLVELVLGFPDDAKIGQANKHLLVKAMGERLPASITQRAKMGFTLPFAQWMRNELKEYCETQIFYLARYPFFKEKALHQLWQRFLNNDNKISWSRVWMLVVLGHWLRQHNIQ